MMLKRLLLLCPLGIVAGGLLLVRPSGSPFESAFARAKLAQREGRIDEALVLYQSIQEREPAGRWGCLAMWEVASIRYSMTHQTRQAAALLNRIGDACEDQELAGRALLLLADIYEIGMQDLDSANQLRLRYLALPDEPLRAHETRFKMADAQFKLGKFDQARSSLETLLRQKPSSEIESQANLRLAAIAQLGGEFDDSIHYFQSVFANSSSPEFRLQAQLGMIESYEYLNELEKALSVANRIESPDYAVNLKDDTVSRLNRKLFQFEP